MESDPHVPLINTEKGRVAIKRLHELAAFEQGLDFRQAIKGLDLYRSVEYFWFLLHVDIATPARVLDIGSWRSPLPSFLASKGWEVVSLDVEEGCEIQRTYARKKGLTTLRPFVVPHFTGRIKYDLPSDRFDLITCICTIEHFENEGDMDTISEIHRLLAPGGTAFLTAPYGSKYSEHRHFKWFERRYDLNALQQRLFQQAYASRELLFFGDHRSARYIKYYWKLPSAARFVLGRFWLPCAKNLLASDRATQEDARLCGLVLRK